MANRRMFSLDVIDTDRFLDMPLSSQALYFQLGMRADDDGFISSPKRVTSLIGGSPDDLKLLITKGYLIPFESGVVVITEWHINNWIRPDRKHDTRFSHELSLIELKDDVYQINSDLLPLDNQMTTKRHTEVRLGKVKLGKDSIDNNISSEPEANIKLSGILIPLVDNSVYDVPLDKIDIWAAAYPAVDIMQELKKMIAWCNSNPTKKKTKRGIERFINNWLSRTQDSGKGSRSTSSYNRASEQLPEYEEPDYLKNISYDMTPEDLEFFGMTPEEYAEMRRKK